MTRLYCCPALLILAPLTALGCGGEGAPPSLGVIPSEAEGHPISVRGPNANDLWVVGCASSGAPTVLHYDGSSWRSIAPPHPGECAVKTGNGRSVHPVGGGMAWFSDASVLARIHADGTAEDFTTEVVTTDPLARRLVAGSGDTTLVVQPTQTGSELYVMQSGHFTGPTPVPFGVSGMQLWSATDGWGDATSYMPASNTNLAFSHRARWNGTALTLAEVAFNDPFAHPAVTINPSFRPDFVWIMNPSIPEPRETTLALIHYDGTAWTPMIVPAPAAPNGHLLARPTLVRSSDGILVAIGGDGGSIDLEHEPGGAGFVDVTYWGLAWDGAAWGHAQNLGTLQRCAGPNCGSLAGNVADSILADGSIVVGSGKAGDDSVYLLKYE